MAILLRNSTADSRVQKQHFSSEFLLDLRFPSGVVRPPSLARLDSPPRLNGSIVAAAGRTTTLQIRRRSWTKPKAKSRAMIRSVLLNTGPKCANCARRISHHARLFSENSEQGWEERHRGKGSSRNRKGCNIGYALVANSCEGVNGVEQAPSQPLMRPLLSQFQTPTASREGCRFFRVWWPNELPRWADHPAYFGLATDWEANPFSHRRA
jgi:hypothetical protein